MAERTRNFLLGKGENLTDNAVVAAGFGSGNKPYSLSDAQRYIGRKAATVAKQLDALPPLAYRTVPNGKRNPKSTGFFKAAPFMSEAKLRADAHKWEPTLQATKKMRGGLLAAPCFDIHYNPRNAGHDAQHPQTIPYAMVVSVHAPKMPKVYDSILARYRHQLEPLRPRLKLRV